MTELVWYAAYGSNLSRARFYCYLHGGCPQGAGYDFPGCRDQSAPLEDRPFEIAPELAFGGTSRTWGGGVAFVDPDSTNGARARLYLITADQLADVVAQENWLEPGSVTIDEFEKETDLGADRTYGLVVPLGELEAKPVVTFTQHRGAALARPSIAYLQHIAQGLSESHALSIEEICAFLGTARGVDPVLSEDELRTLSSLLE
ncbi:MAG TPA: histone deacetylase [Actinomycetota bacterium]|nr:histone deacetylase [Actinomycetota bacterium]